ncbi:MAG: hypothetical protein LBL66_01435 [Clostridiales bacterium]|jgi:hypothetical protein|nr:hypothetical protein [Clostridiales bacterium]
MNRKRIAILLAIVMAAGIVAGACGGKAKTGTLTLEQTEYSVEYGDRFTMPEPVYTDKDGAVDEGMDVAVKVTDSAGAEVSVSYGVFYPEIGVHTAVYSAEDGRVTLTVTITCADTQAPTVRFSNFQNFAFVGDGYAIPAFIAEDKAGVDESYTQAALYKGDPTGTPVATGIGESAAVESGADYYTLRIKVKDKSGNAVDRDYRITVRPAWTPQTARSFDTDITNTDIMYPTVTDTGSVNPQRLWLAEHEGRSGVMAFGHKGPTDDELGRSWNFWHVIRREFYEEVPSASETLINIDVYATSGFLNWGIGVGLNTMFDLPAIPLDRWVTMSVRISDILSKNAWDYGDDMKMYFGTTGGEDGALAFYIDKIYTTRRQEVNVGVEGGTASPSSGLKWGDTVTLTRDAIPEGKIFSGWAVDGDAEEVGANMYKVYGDATFTAVFVRPELSIPAGATMLRDFSSDVDLWKNTVLGSATHNQNWLAEYNNHAGVMAFGSTADGNNFNYWLILSLADYTYGELKDSALYVRMYVDGSKYLNWGDGRNIVGAFAAPALDEWTVEKIRIADYFAGMDDSDALGEVHFFFGTKASGDAFYIDQIYLAELESATVGVNNGTASPPSGLKWGDTVTLTPGTPPEGKVFSSWTVDGDAEEISANVYKVYGDVTFTAVFTIPEIATPSGAVMARDFSSDVDLWYNTNMGSGTPNRNWLAEYEGHAGVMAFGSSADGNNFNYWFILSLAGYTYGELKDSALYVRMYVDGSKYLNWGAGSGSAGAFADPALDEWTVFTISIADYFAGMEDSDQLGEAHLFFGTKASGNAFYIDQIYVAPLE